MIRKITFIRMTALLLALYSLTGCHKEDYSFCPPEVAEDNVRLEFRLAGGEGFRDNVTTVRVDIYDGGGTYLQTEQITQAAINEYAEMVVTLPPGDYRMVFWANTGGNTTISGTDRVTYTLISGTAPPTTGNGDRVYYAPYGATRADNAPLEYYALRVPDVGDYSDIVYFTHAHRSLEIYVKGLSQDPATQPTIEIEGLPAGLGYFGMTALTGASATVTASQAASLTQLENIIYSMATFDTFLFDDMEGIDIVIRDADGNELYRIPLADAVEESSADPDKIIIRLVFTFMNGSVTVTLPGWNSGETGIEF